MLNGKELNTFHFDASELLNGGELILEMGQSPTKTGGFWNSYFNIYSIKNEYSFT
jgi:putative alpha-1,2-mannosidase